MKSQLSEEGQRVLTLLKLDAKRLFERIRDREAEYMFVYSNKRTREHFKEIFKNRYEAAEISDLKLCSQEVIIGLDNFYSSVDEMRWYLNHTEEMPSTVDMKVKGYIRNLKPLYETLNLYINAELGISESLSPEEKNDALDSIITPSENAPDALEEDFTSEPESSEATEVDAEGFWKQDD